MFDHAQAESLIKQPLINIGKSYMEIRINVLIKS